MRHDTTPSPALVLLKAGLLLVLCAGIVACGGNSDSETVSSSTSDEDMAMKSEEGTSQKEEPVPIGDNLDFEDSEGETDPPSDEKSSRTGDPSTTEPSTEAPTEPGTGRESSGAEDPSDERTSDGRTSDGRTSDGRTSDGRTSDGRTNDERTNDERTNDERTSPTERRDPPSDAPSAQTSEKHTLQVFTEPGTATVTLRSQTRDLDVRREKQSPATFEVPPGQYTWTVKKEGYASKQAEEPVDLRTSQEWIRTVELSSAPDDESSSASESASSEASYLDRADRARQNGNYQEAITLYQNVPEPEAGSTTDDYIRAQMRLGELYWKQENNYSAAVRTYKNIINRDPSRYEPFLNLAYVQIESGNYESALNYLDRVGELKYQIRAQDQKRRKISLRVQYRRAVTLYEQVMSDQVRDRREKAERANQQLQVFLSRVPSSLKSEFKLEIEDAEEKLQTIREKLRTEIR